LKFYVSADQIWHRKWFRNIVGNLTNEIFIVDLEKEDMNK